MGMNNKLLIPSDVPVMEDVEKGAIGCIALGALEHAIAKGVNADSFHNDHALAIWHACRKLHDKELPLNEVNIAKLAPEAGMYLIGAIEAAPTAHNLVAWLPDLLDTAKRRGVFLRYNHALREIADPDIETDIILRRQEENFFAASTSYATQKTQTDDWKRLREMIQSAKGSGLPDKGIRYGLPQIDHYLRGLKPGSMNTIAARPGCGKTAFAMQVALNVASEGRPVFVWSYEVPTLQMMQRLVCTHSGHDVGSHFEYGHGMAEKMIQSAYHCESLPIHFEDSVDVTISRLRGQARRAVKDRGIELFVVDYLQKVPIDRHYKDRTREVAELSSQLKNAALETGVPFLVLAQMNRSIEERAGEPRLSDLKESGSIEQDSDTVAFLHQDPNDKEFLQFCLKKNRHGQTAKVALNWQKSTGRFRSAQEFQTTEEAPV
jgi:replicative DNA helicase